MLPSHEFLRHIREKRGLSQDALAEKCGWPQSRVSRIENGKQKLSADDLDTVAAAFGISVAEFQRLRLRRRAA